MKERRGISLQGGAAAAGVLLGILYDRRESFTPLRELAAAARCSDAAIGEALAELQGGGQRFESSPAHGVRLVSPVRLDARLIERKLGTRRIGRHVICFGEVDSTNDVAKDSARQAGADGLVVLAESQRRGRGRLGRSWISPPGSNVLMSVLLIDAGSKRPPEAVALAAGLAAAEGIDQITHLACRLKWPNDVLLDGRKVCGVLVELAEAAKGRAVVVGIGINVNSCPPPSRLPHPATSLARCLGGEVERVEIIRAILRRLDRWVADIQAGRVDRLRSAWLSRCSMLNQRLTVACGGRRYVGRAIDINPLSGLLLSGDHGELIRLPAETSTILG